MQEILLFESSTLRQQYCTEERTNVLDRVGQLRLLPGEIFATTEQVANFYMVPVQAIKSLVFDHKDEFLPDGYNVLSVKEMGEFPKGTFKSRARSAAIFPKRAVLRVGCLLRDVRPCAC